MSKSSITIDEVRLGAVHPGEILSEELDEIGVSRADLAAAIAVPETQVGEILQGEGPVTADLALRLARYFGTSARFWLNLQAAYDLATTRARYGERIDAVVRPFVHS